MRRAPRVCAGAAQNLVLPRKNTLPLSRHSEVFTIGDRPTLYKQSGMGASGIPSNVLGIPRKPLETARRDLSIGCRSAPTSDT
jgi:hypothetical protein